MQQLRLPGGLGGVWGEEKTALLRFLPAAGDGGCQPWGAISSSRLCAPILPCSFTHRPFISALPEVWGQKWCKATPEPPCIRTAVTPRRCPGEGWRCCSPSYQQGMRLGSGCRGVSTDPVRPQHQDGFTSVIWVADKVTSGPWLDVTTGFLLSSKVSAGSAGPWVSNPFNNAEPEPQSLSRCGSWSPCGSLHNPCSLHLSLPPPPKIPLQTPAVQPAQHVCPC